MKEKEEIKPGTMLFSRRFNIVGIVVSLYRPSTDQVFWYDVDSDDEFFWVPNEVIVIDEKEYLFRKLKNDIPAYDNINEDYWVPFK